MNVFKYLLNKVSLGIGFLVLFSGCGVVDRSIATPAPTFIPTPTVMPTPTNADSQRTDVPFTSLVRRNATGTHEVSEPKLVIIGNLEEALTIQDWVSKEGQEALATTDYEQFTNIGVFRERHPNTGYEIEVIKVTKIDDAITIWVQFFEPKPGFEVSDLVTDPYEIIQVRKEDIEGATKFILFADGIVVDERTVNSN